MIDSDPLKSANANPVLCRLGDTDIRDFLANDWHRNARVFRQAIEGFQPICDIDTLLDLALDPDAETRLIAQSPSGWSLTQGPLDALPDRQQRGWTVLIQGLNLCLPAASSLLDRFRFVPESRLDDLMVSFASDGGGVGPHFDSYDVFLLQMHGQRRWRISAQKDLSLLPGLPLKILGNFQPEQEFVLNPGDMLYLPPHYAHDGVAVGECTTLSIGFRAPTAAELLASVFQRLADDVAQDRTLQAVRFADPQRGFTDHPGQLPADLLSFVRQHLEHYKPAVSSLEAGLLIHGTEPKDNVVFDTPARAPTARKVLSSIQKNGLQLNRASRLIIGTTGFAINGEMFQNFGEAHHLDHSLLAQLADQRCLSPHDCAALTPDSAFLQWVVSMVDAGWIDIISQRP